MNNAIGLTKKLEEAVLDIATKCMQLERDNSHLKASLKIFAKSIRQQDNGEVVFEISEEDLTYLKYVIDNLDVFGVRNSVTLQLEGSEE